MTKNYSKFSLHSYKKVLPILLFVMLIIPKNVFAYTIRYNSTFGLFSNGTTENVVEYDDEHNVISGTYEVPVYDTGIDSSNFIAWYEEFEAENRVKINEISEDITVYAAYEKVVLLRQDYTGQEEIFNSPINRYLQYELWGAQGGPSINTINRGLGGYSSGFVKSNIIYINIGEQGIKGIYNAYNGGGSPSTANGGSGGGATHIATTSGLLSTLSSNRENVMIVAGGGGGAGQMTTPITTITGSGGGFQGAKGGGPMYYGYGGTQTAGGTSNGVSSYYNNRKASFGLGGNGENGGGGNANAGGGGGWFGGGGTGWASFTNRVGIAGGGSGYIGNDRTYDGVMYGYNVPTSDETKTLTYSTTNYSNEAITGYAKEGNGYVQANLIRVWAHFNWNDGNEQIPSEKHYEMYPNEVVPPSVTPRDGYEFEWRKEGEDTAYDFSIPITRDTNFVGVWIPIIYNITYNLDGGELESGVTNPDTYTIESDPITLNNQITKEHYTFKGWSGTDLTGDENLTVTIQTGSIGDREYTAHWTPIEYTITYDLDGGELETGVTNPDTYTIESNDITLNNPVREGFTFLGWTGSNGTTPTNVLIPTGSTGNKTYKANYKIDRHTAIFDSNLGEDAVPETITKDYNEELGTLPTTSRRGYIFEGWFTGKTDGTKISSTTKMPPYNPTYYAHWTPITYTMRFNSNGGEGTMSDEVISYGTSKALTDNAFTKEGYTFAGWNSKADGTGTNYINKQEVFNLTDVDGTVFNLYAVWTKDEYIISYNLGGGQVTNPVTTYSIDTEDFNLVNPTKAGYTFTGWTGSNGTVEEETVTIVKGTTGNKEYTAHYKAVDYNITYLSNNDDAIVTGIGNPVTYTVEDSNITLNNPSDPDTYHYFVGWTTNLDTEEDLSMNYTIDTSLIKDITVYAVYQTSPYTVYFDSDGGNEIDPISREGTEDVGVLPIPKKEGYTFKGWFVNNILIDETFHSRVDVTAVAKWEKIEIPVDVTPVDNPTTGDNILKHVMLLVISLIGLGISTVKFKLKLKTKKVL